jgi:hypothetical protein
MNLGRSLLAAMSGYAFVTKPAQLRMPQLDPS